MVYSGDQDKLGLCSPVVHGPRGCHLNGWRRQRRLTSNMRNKYWFFYVEKELQGYLVNTEPLGEPALETVRKQSAAGDLVRWRLRGQPQWSQILPLALPPSDRVMLRTGPS